MHMSLGPVTWNASILEHVKLAIVLQNTTRKGPSSFCSLSMKLTQTEQMLFMQPMCAFLSTCCKTLRRLKLTKPCLTVYVMDVVPGLPALQALTLDECHDLRNRVPYFIQQAPSLLSVRHFTICVAWSTMDFFYVRLPRPVVTCDKSYTHARTRALDDPTLHDAMGFAENARESGPAITIHQFEVYPQAKGSFPL